jgi:DNA-binding transcriptional LysR family regulator
VVSRRGRTHGPIDDALEARGLRRRVVATMPAFSAVLHTAASSDLVGQTLARVGAPMIEALDLVALPLPFDLPPVIVSMGWHPRFDNDPAQRWFRDRVRAAFDQEP